MSTKQAGVFALGLLAAAAAGCERSADRPPPAANGALRVAIVLPGAHDDHEWSQAGYEGLQLIGRELQAQISYAENVPEARFEKTLRGFAAAGNHFVIAHGGEFEEAAEVVAAECPRTQFALVALYPGNNRNLGAVRFREAELGFLTGAVAALRSSSGEVSYVAGMKFRHLEEQARSFVQGAKAINPQIEVRIEWLGSWTDSQKARQVARALLAEGVDVISVNADEAGLAIFDELKQAGKFGIGWNLDQHAIAPGVVVTSGIQRVDVLLLEAARLVLRGWWDGKQYRFGLREGAQDLAPFRGLLSEEDAAQVEALREGILRGTVDLSP